MKKKVTLALPLFALSLAASGCDFSLHLSIYSSSDSSTASDSQSASVPDWDYVAPTSDTGYYKATEVNKTVNFHKVGKHSANPTLPSTGTPKILVLPIGFSNPAYAFTDKRLADIQTAVSGTAEETKYWESLKSYYATSSYGKLDMDFVFADPYIAATTPMEFYRVNKNTVFFEYDNLRYTYEDKPEALPQLAMQKAIEQYQAGGGDTTQFDSDKDGFVDAVIMVYSCHNSTNDPLLKGKKYGDLFWAYQYSDMTITEVDGDVASPIGNRYFWASYDFFYEGVSEGKGVDAHTLIHEMGHILGADDYYNYAEGERAEPSGCLMMMSNNIADHDIFSKLSYSWVEPYVVTGDCTITINPSNSSGDCILLADSWNGTCFDEFVIFELYTPDRLNQLDSTKAYHGKTKALSQAGVRAFHIDNRLVFANNNDPESGRPTGAVFLSDGQVNHFDEFVSVILKKGDFVAQGVTNTAYYDASVCQGRGYELIQIIQADGVNTTRNGTVSVNADLFQSGDTFSLSSHHAFFPNRNKLNNGNDLPYEVTFDSVSATSATLSFRKVS